MQNRALYISARELPSDVLRTDLSAKVQVVGDDASWSSADVDLGDAQIDINRLSDRAALDEHLEGLCDELSV